VYTRVSTILVSRCRHCRRNLPTYVCAARRASLLFSSKEKSKTKNHACIRVQVRSSSMLGVTLSFFFSIFIGVQVRNSGPGVTLPGDMEKNKRDANLKKGSLEISTGAHQRKNEKLCASETRHKVEKTRRHPGRREQ